MNAIQIWILAIRPKTLIASISPVSIGTALSIKLGRFDCLTFLCTLCTALGIQITTNLANDYFDYIKGADTSLRIGPIRTIQAKLISQKSMCRAIVISMLLTALSGAYLIVIGKTIIAFLLVLSLSLSILYTTGPYPLAYLGLGDFFVCVFFGPIAVGGSYYLQTQSLSLEALLAGIAPGVLSTAILIVNNIRDMKGDLLANKRTLAVRFGILFSKWEYLSCLLLSFGSICLFYDSYPYTLYALFCLPVACSLIKKMFTYKDPKELNLLLIKTSQLLCLFTVLFCIGLML